MLAGAAQAEQLPIRTYTIADGLAHGSVISIYNDYGKTMSKLDILYLYITHEMYHRGQITVYERLLQIEPAATAKVRELLLAQG